jgi:putative glutamine amidotransferase
MALIIGLTQRVTVDDRTGEVRDSLDQRWSALLSSMAYIPVPIPNQIESIGKYIKQIPMDAFILTGGGNLDGYGEPSTTSPERELVESTLIDHCLESGTPLLGVCRGLQAITVHLGGRLIEVSGHVAKHHSINVVADDEWLNRQNQDRVNSYHDYGIDRSDLPSSLVPIAFAPDDTVEAAKISGARMLGIMWHPERESPVDVADINLIRNLFEVTSE